MSNEIAATQGTNRVLTEKDLNKCGRRWCMSVNGFNYETQLAPSVVFAEKHALRKIYKDDESYRKSLANSFRYFNATPPVAGLLLGAGLAMEDAKAYGTDAVLLVPGVVSEEVPYDACWERSTECIKKLVPVAEKLKVKICLENVWNNFLLSPIEACSYIDQFKSPYVRFYFDCGNILVYGWPEQWIPILGKRIGRIHIKEFSREIADREGRWNGFNVKLTEGNVNWAKVMEQIRKHYRGGWLTTEQGGGASPEELQDLCARLDRIFEM